MPAGVGYGHGPDAPWVLRAREHARGVPGLGFLAKAGAFVSNPFVGMALGAAGSLAQSVWSARRADSAHQREMRDYQAAGLNPMLAATQGRGSEVGQMTSVGEGINSALSVQRQRAEISLLEAQADAVRNQGRLSAVQAGDIETTAAGGRLDKLRTDADAAAFALEQARKQAPLLIQRTRAEISQLKTSAQRNQAETMLARANEILTGLRSETERVSARYAEDWLELYDKMGDAGYPLRLVALALGTILNVRR